LRGFDEVKALLAQLKIYETDVYSIDEQNSIGNMQPSPNIVAV
jgi:hypothetical protein